YAPNQITPRRRGRRGAAGVLQFASSGVAADVRVERVDRRNRCSWYALDLAANESAVTGRLVGVHRGGDVEELGALDAAAGSMGFARFAVTTPRTGAYRTMYLEIRSGEMILRVEAPLPPAAPRFGMLKIAGGSLVLALAAFAAAAPFGFTRDANGAAAPRA